MYTGHMKPHMGKQPVNIRCSPDTIEAVEQYAEDNDLGKSEAYRRVIREGVMLHGYDLDVPEQADRNDVKYQARQTGTLVLVGSMLSGALGSVITLASLGVL